MECCPLQRHIEDISLIFSHYGFLTGYHTHLTIVSQINKLILSGHVPKSPKCNIYGIT